MVQWMAQNHDCEIFLTMIYVTSGVIIPAEYAVPVSRVISSFLFVYNY
jgi:hypothetical protein